MATLLQSNKRRANGHIFRSMLRNQAVALKALHGVGGSISDTKGQVGGKLLDLIKDDITVKASASVVNSQIIKPLVDMGFLARTVRGKRTFNIEVIQYPLDVDEWLTYKPQVNGSKPAAKAKPSAKPASKPKADDFNSLIAEFVAQEVEAKVKQRTDFVLSVLETAIKALRDASTK